MVGLANTETYRHMANPNPVTAHLIPFVPGQSGNPNGRPKGRRGFPQLIREAITDEEALALVRSVLQRAMNGEQHAMDWLAKYELADRLSAQQPQILVQVLAQLQGAPTEVLELLASEGVSDASDSG